MFTVSNSNELFKNILNFNLLQYVKQHRIKKFITKLEETNSIYNIKLIKNK